MMLTADDVHVKIGAITALRGFSMSIDQG
ncbi:MAG: ABC-type uncharacterized transport system ATPase subunit, partial [Paracoccaceae bacterium]